MAFGLEVLLPGGNAKQGGAWCTPGVEGDVVYGHEDAAWGWAVEIGDDHAIHLIPLTLPNFLLGHSYPNPNRTRHLGLQFVYLLLPVIGFT